MRQTLQVVDLPFQDAPHLGVVEAGGDVIGETLTHERDRVVDHVDPGLALCPSLRLLPYEGRHHHHQYGGEQGSDDHLSGHRPTP